MSAPAGSSHRGETFEGCLGEVVVAACKPPAAAVVKCVIGICVGRLVVRQHTRDVRLCSAVKHKRQSHKRQSVTQSVSSRPPHAHHKRAHWSLKHGGLYHGIAMDGGVTDMSWFGVVSATISWSVILLLT